MNLPTLKEIHPPLAELEKLHARALSTKAEKTAKARKLVERIEKGAPDPGNAYDNRLRAILGRPSLQESLPDQEGLNKLRHEIEEADKDAKVLYGELQRARDTASRKLCEAQAPRNKALLNDWAKKLSECHQAHLSYIKFLDEIEATGSSTSYLRPIFSKFIGDPRSKTDAYHYVFSDMLEAGHIEASLIPSEVR
jgi:hypothetical protein